MISGLAITLIVAVLIVTVLILNRVLPVVKGSARPSDSRDEKFLKWNSFIMPMMRRHLEKGIQAGLAGTFRSEHDGQLIAIGTWSLETTVLPDVDFVAIARPDPERGDAVNVLGFISAERLQDILDGTVQMQTMFGHITWIYAWPGNMDFEAFQSELTPPDSFRAQYGLPSPEVDEEE